ncbi:MAG TPA: hypothetical protein VK206_01040 [Anaerolineales bacterium]|nr:hypothetical protein [Anaerolineales bacterium]
MENRCWEYLKPLLEELHGKVDRRLVKTMLDLVMVILMQRNRNSGLLLSGLGDHLLGGERGPAGVKRIASLLHSHRSRSGLIVKYLWGRADEKVKELKERKEEIYVIWDEGVLEKSESLQAARRPHWPSFIIFVLSYAGTPATIRLDPMDANMKAGKSLGANVPGTIIWCGMHADDVSEKVGRLKCPSVSPNVKWRLNPPAYSPGKPASNSCSSRPSLMPSYFLSCPILTSYFTCSPPTATER